MPTFIVSPAPREGARMPVRGPFPTRQSAEHHATKNDYVIENGVDVIWSGPLLVEVFNAITGSRLKKFESFTVGTRRLLAALPEHAIAPRGVNQSDPSRGFVGTALDDESDQSGSTLTTSAANVASDVTAGETTPTYHVEEPMNDPVELYDTIANQESAPTVAEVAPPKKRSSYFDAETEAAVARGDLPKRIVITSAANKHRQKHFDALADAAETGDWDKVAAYQMKGTDTYCKMIHRYRDLLLQVKAARS